MKKLEQKLREAIDKVNGKIKKNLKEFIYPEISEVFARKIYGYKDAYLIVYKDTGEAVTRLDAGVYPIDMANYPLTHEVSAKYEHPGGIYLSKKDVRRLGIEIE